MLILKVLLAPALIGLASWVGRRWGPTPGGWLAALPLTSGPVVFVLAFEQGPAFTRNACAGILLALVSLAAFALAYCWSAPRMHWACSSAIACLAFLVCTWTLQPLVVPLPWAFLIACGTLCAASRAIPASPVASRPSVTPVWDIPLRMLVAAVLVAALTLAAGALGPHMSGLLTPFPVAATILAACTHCFEGPAAAGHLLRALLIGLFSFAVFFLVVGELITEGGIVVAFITAAVAAFAFHAVVWRQVGASFSGRSASHSGGAA